MPAGNETNADLFPDFFKEAVAELFSQQRYGAVLLRQEEVGAACPPEQFLSEQELERYQNYRLPKRRCEFLGGRICAKLALQQYHPELPLPPQLIEIASAPGGRPLLSLPEVTIFDDLYLSISHGGHLVGAVVAEVPCGLDLQPIRSNLVKVREKYCLPEEERLLDSSLPGLDDESRLVLLWTAKEAAKKALSYRHMYGFLEFRLATLRPLTSSCFALGLHLVADNATGAPAELFVTAASINGYGVALCFVDKK